MCMVYSAIPVQLTSIVGFAAVRSVGFVDHRSQLRGVTGSFPLLAFPGRRASCQLVCDRAWSAADHSGYGTYTIALLL